MAQRLIKFDWRIIPMLLITAAVVGVLISSLAGVDDFAATLATADFTWLGISLVVMVFAVLAAIWRLQVVVSAMGYPVSFLRASDAIIATWPLALITPSRAGDLVRAWILRDVCPPVEGSGAVVVERMIDIQSLCILAMVGSAIIQQWVTFGIAFLVMLAEWVFVFGVVLNQLYHRLPILRNKAEKIDRFLHSFKVMREKPFRFAMVNVISILAWLANVGIVYALLVAFDAKVTWLNTLAAWPIALFAGLMPVTVGGLGTRDAGFYVVLTMLQPADEARVLAASLGYAVITLWIFSMVGLPFMIRHMLRERALKDSEA